MPYTWTTPVTNRTDGTSTMSADDMTRISNNTAYLQENITGTVSVKTSWNRTEFIHRADWEQILTVLSSLARAVGVDVLPMTNVMIWSNINNVEAMTLAIYNAPPAAIDDVLVNNVSVVENEVGVIDDADFLSTSTINKWNNIL